MNGRSRSTSGRRADPFERAALSETKPVRYAAETPVRGKSLSRSWTAKHPRLYALATAVAARFLHLLGGRDGMIVTLPFGREWTRGRFFPAPKSGRTFRSLYAARPKRLPAAR